MSTEHLILPVGTRVALIDIMFVGMTVFIVKVSRIGALLAGILILHQYKFIRVHHIQFVGKRLGLYIGIQADRNTTLRRILGCHQNNAVGSTSTINSCRSGILQYFNRFDIRGRNIIQAVYFKTVENNQRTVVLCDRAAATYQNLNFRIGRTIDRRHLYARQFTDNSFGCRSCLHFFQNLSRHTGDRTGKITSFLSTVTNNDYISQHTGRLSHVYINTRSTTLQRFFHFFHTYKTDFQNSLVHIRNVCQCEFAIQIRSTTQCRTLYNHSGADYRTIVVGHRTCYGGSLCHCTDRYHQQSKYAYD